MSQIITTKILRVTQLNNSRNANPAYMLHTLDGDFRTATDSACAYGAGNPENLSPNVVDLALDRGRVTHITPLGEEVAPLVPTTGKGRFNKARAEMNQQAAARRVQSKVRA